MIFDSRIIMLPDGENMNIYETDVDEMDIFYFSGGLKQKHLKLKNIVRCENVPIEFTGEFIKKISDTLVCLGYQGNITILNTD